MGLRLQGIERMRRYGQSLLSRGIYKYCPTNSENNCAQVRSILGEERPLSKGVSMRLEAL